MNVKNSKTTVLALAVGLVLSLATVAAQAQSQVSSGEVQSTNITADVAPAPAQFTKESKFSGLYSTGVESEYLAINGRVFSKSPSWQNAIEGRYDVGDFGEVWGRIFSYTALGGRRFGSTYGDEEDFWGGWDRSFGPLKFNLCGSYKAIGGELDQMRNDIWTADQEISVPRMPFVQPYLHSRYFGSVDPGYWKPGWFIFGGFKKGFSFGHFGGNKPAALNVDLSTAYTTGALRNFQGFVYGKAAVCLEIPLGKRMILWGDLGYQVTPPGDYGDKNAFTYPGGNKCVYGIGLKYPF